MGEMTAVRDVYGAALKELGEQDLRVVGLETDVASSTKSGVFRNAFPERYFSAGANKPNTASMIAGFTRTGFVSFVNTSTVFLATRGTGPIQGLIAYDKLNVRLCGTYCGLSGSYSGVNHQATTDMAFVRSIPNVTVISTADGPKTRKTVPAIAKHWGPVYLRLSHAPAPVFCGNGMRLEIGKGIYAREGSDVTIITTGTLLHNVIQTAAILEAEGVRAAVVNTHTVKPIDQNLILECVEQTGAIVTMEEHSICGGLSSAVTKVLTEYYLVPMERVGAVDSTEPEDYDQLVEKCGYDPESVTLRCRAAMGRRQGNET